MADIRTALLAMDTVTALVGTGASARIRPYKFDQSDDLSESHIVIDINSQRRENSVDGLGGLVYASVSISCRDRDSVEAETLAEAVRVNGTDPGTGLAGITAASFDAVLESETPGTTWYGDNSARIWYEVTQEYEMSYSETT